MECADEACVVSAVTFVVEARLEVTATFSGALAVGQSPNARPTRSLRLSRSIFVVSAIHERDTVPNGPCYYDDLFK